MSNPTEAHCPFCPTLSTETSDEPDRRAAPRPPSRAPAPQAAAWSAHIVEKHRFRLCLDAVARVRASASSPRCQCSRKATPAVPDRDDVGAPMPRDLTPPPAAQLEGADRLAFGGDTAHLHCSPPARRSRSGDRRRGRVCGPPEAASARRGKTNIPRPLARVYGRGSARLPFVAPERRLGCVVGSTEVC